MGLAQEVLCVCRNYLPWAAAEGHPRSFLYRVSEETGKKEQATGERLWPEGIAGEWTAPALGFTSTQAELPVGSAGTGALCA